MGYAVRNAGGTNRLVAAGGLAAAVLVLVLSVSAFVVAQNDQPSSGGSVGALAADFSLRDAEANRVTLAELVSDRPVVLLFCGETDEALDAAHAASLSTAGSAVRLVAVRQGTDASPALQQLADAMGEPVIDLNDSNGAVAERYGVRLDASTPLVAMLVDQQGTILDRGSIQEVAERLPSRLAG